jgi:hypothetical protein
MAIELSFGLQADPAEEPQWAAFARRVEQLGFDRLSSPTIRRRDRPRSWRSPPRPR